MALVALALAASLGCGDDSGAPDDDGGADVVDTADVPVDVEDLPESDVEPDDGADGDDGDDDGGDDGGPTEAPVGAPCATGDDCLDGDVPAECLGNFFGILWPGGYCSALGCMSDDECVGGPTEAICVRGGDGPPLCLDRCDVVADDCRAGYHCLDPDGAGPLPGVCLPFCRGAFDCDTGEICTGEPPMCRPATGGAMNGEACASRVDCAVDSACNAEDGILSGWPGGLCTQACLADIDCTNGGACVLNCEDDNDTPGDDCDDDGTPGLDEGAEGTCLVACDPADSTACPRAGYSCRAVGENIAGPVHVCTADCSETGACTIAGYECDPAAGMFGGEAYGLGRCQPPFVASQLGEACTLTSGCTGGTCLAEAFAGFPHGMCVEECIAGPGGDRCPGTAQCLARPGEAGWCMDLCTPGGADCREGYECQVPGGMAWLCFPACTSNAQCEFGCCDGGGSGFCDAGRESCL